MEGVVAHCAVRDDINASHQQYRPTGLWYDHISQYQGSHSRHARHPPGLRQHRFVQQCPTPGDFQASPPGNGINGPCKRPERADVGDAHGDEHGHTQGNADEGKQRPQAML